MAQTDILEALQTINAAVTGVVQAPTEFPGQLNSSDLPMALSYPERAEYEVYAREGSQETRTWFVRVYIQPIAQGRSVDEGFGKTVVFVDRFRAEYQKLANQRAADWWSEIELVADSGVLGDLKLHNVGTTLYWGVEIELSIIVNHDLDA